MEGLKFPADFDLPIIEELAFVVPGSAINFLQWEFDGRLHVWYIRFVGSFAARCSQCISSLFVGSFAAWCSQCINSLFV